MQVLIAAMALVVLTLFYIRIFGPIVQQSDFASIFLAGRDMLAGNWRLKGWWLPPDPFWTTDIPIYGLAGLIFGLDPKVLVYVPALLWSAVTVAACAVAVARGEKRGRLWALPVILTLLGLPLLRSSMVMVQVAHAPMHMASLLLILATFVMAAGAIERGVFPSKTTLGCLGGTTFLAVAGDPLVVVVGVLPIAGATAICLYRPLASRLAVVGTVLIASITANIALKANEYSGGFAVMHTLTLGFVFASYPQFVANISYIAQNLLRIFGAWFFDAHVVYASPELLRLVLLLLAVVIVSRAVKRSLAEFGLTGLARIPSCVRITPLNAMLMLGIVLDVLAVLVSRVVFDDYSAARYLFPTLVFGAILVAREAGSWPWVRMVAAAALVSSVFAVVQTYRNGPQQMVLAPPGIRQLASWLEEHKLAAGYGPFGTAALVTTLSKGEVNMRAIGRDGRGGVDMMRWLTSAAWYPTPINSRKPAFIVVEKNAPAAAFRESEVVSTFGQPNGRAAVGDYAVLLY
jgi:hypothetical protein